jgi:hypothetical protein
MLDYANKTLIRCKQIDVNIDFTFFVRFCRCRPNLELRETLVILMFDIKFLGIVPALVALIARKFFCETV